MADAPSGLAGVMLWVDDLACSSDFYIDVVGLTPRTRNHHLTSFVWGDLKFNLSQHDQVHGPAREPLRLMINLLVDDIGATWRRMAARGVVFSRAPEQEGWGGWIATFADPDGNILQLLQPAAAPHPHPVD